MQFIDIKNRISEPEVQHILSLSMYMPTPEKINSLIENFLADDKRRVYGVVVNDIIIGVVGFSIGTDGGEAIVIHHIAVTEAQRKKGVGRFIINSLLNEYQSTIELETDDEAVDFYRKCGFETAAFIKHGVRRWKCRLPVLK
jgi:GNAT superfamily N-acetyltransferase